MSKKLLAAVFAAAFLATGGVAKAGTDYEYDRDTSAVWTTGSHFNGTLTGTVTASGASGGTPSIGIYAIKTTSSGTVVTTATLEALAGGTISVGSAVGTTSGSVPVTAIDLAVSNFSITGGTLNIANATGALTTTAASTIDADGEVNVAGALTLGGTLSNSGAMDVDGELTLNAKLTNTSTGYIDFKTATASDLTFGSNFDNSATSKDFDPSKITLATDLDVGAEVDDGTMTKVVTAAVAGKTGGNAGHILVNGAITDGTGRDMSTLGAGSILTFDTAQTGTTNAFELGDGAANLIANGTYASDFSAAKIYAGFAGGSTNTELSGALTTDALAVNNGIDATDYSKVTLSGNALNTTNSTIGAIQIGSDATDGKFSILTTDGAADFTDIAVTNYGMLDNDGDNIITLGAYAAGGVIKNSGNTTGNPSAQGAIQTAANNTASMANIVQALTNYDSNNATTGQGTGENMIGNLILTGQLAADGFDLTAYNKNKAVDAGLVKLDAKQTGKSAMDLGKKVDLLGGGTFKSVKAGTWTVDVDTAVDENVDTALDMQIASGGGATQTFTLGENGVFVKDADNDITFTTANNTFVNKGIVNLDGESTGPTDQQVVDFVGAGTGFDNQGTINVGKNTTFNTTGNGHINNFIGDKDGIVNVVGDAVDLADLSTLLLADTLNNADKNVGTLNVNGDLANNLALSTALEGAVTLNGKQVGAQTVNVGGADLDITGDENDMTGAIAAGTVTISGNNGDYTNTITAQEGITVTGEKNNFTGLLRTTIGDIDIDNGGDYSGGLYTDEGNINIEKGGNFGPLTAESNGDNTKGFINIVDGTYLDDITADQAITFKSTGEDKLYVDAGVTTEAKAGDITIDGVGGVFDGTLKTDMNDGYVTTLKKGADATVTGTLDTDFIAQAGSTWRVNGGDVAFTTGASADAAGATIEFGMSDANPARLSKFLGDGASDINLEGARLNVDLEAARNLEGTAQELFDADARDILTGTLATDDGLDAYLLNQDVYTLSDMGLYTRENGSIWYDHVTYDNPYETMGTVLSRNGIAQYDGMISDTTLWSQFAYSELNDSDMTGWSAEDRYLADIFRLASGHTMANGYSLVGQAQEAYAIEQWKNGADWAGALEAVTDTVRNFNRSITNRAYNIGHLLDQVEYDECGNVINSCGGFKNRVWAGYTGQWDKLSDRGWDKGYKYDAHGFNVGIDRVTSSGVAFGAAFGYSKGDYKNYGQLYGDKSKIDNYSFGLFASYNHRAGFFTTISGTYTYSKYKMHNGFSNYGLGYDNAKFHGDSWSVGGKIGYDFKPVQNLTITPTVGLYYYSSRTNRFDTDLRSGMKYSRHTVEAPIDITAKYDIAVGCDSTLSLMGTAGYAYNFHNKGTKISSFSMGALDTNWGDHRMTKPGRSSWNVGGGAQFRYKNVDFGVHYEYYGRKDFRSHNLNANVGYSF